MSLDSGIRKLYRRDNQPFAQIPNEAIRDPEISAGAFRLLAYLMSHQDGYELTYSQIERQTGMGRYAINEGIKNLERKGWLRTEATKGPDGRYGPKAWFVLDPTSAGFSTAGDSTTEKPTDNKNTTTREDKELRSLAQAKLERAFDEFWNFYPRKVGKGEAKRAFAKAHAKANGDVVLGAQRFAADPNLPTDKNFIPHPATWLNGERWDDEPLPHREKTAEEKAAIAKAEAERRRQVDLAHTKRLREEQRAAEEAVKANPVTRCEHGRVAVICPVCSRKP